MQKIRINPNILKSKKSATIAINDLSHKLISEGKTIYKFGLGQSPFPVLPSMQRELRNNVSRKEYLPPSGLFPLRMQIAEYLNRRFKTDYDTEDIFIGPGSKELIFHSILALDQVQLCIPKGSWVSYGPQATILGKEVHWYDTKFENGFKIQPEHIGENQLVILNYPNNPTGATYSVNELKALADTFRKNGTIVISDEIYGEVAHDAEHQTIAHYYPEGTIVSSGVSKWLGAGGWRLGYFAIPKELRPLHDALNVIASESFTSVSAPIQWASIKAFEDREEIDVYIEKSRLILSAIAKEIYNELNTVEGVFSVPPQGGFYLFSDFTNTEMVRKRKFKSGKEMCGALLEETGCALLPSSDFGFPSNHMGIRMAYVDFDGEKALNSVDIDTKLTSASLRNEICPHMLDGIDELKKWLQG